MPMLYSSPDFEAEYTYHGKDLGAIWSAEKTCFRLWAPTADDVRIQLYRGGDASVNDALVQLPMKRDARGTWYAECRRNLHGVYYTYLVTHGTEIVEACDPYARTTGVNGNRGMIVDLDSTDPAGWADDTYVTQESYTDAVIWAANKGIVTGYGDGTFGVEDVVTREQTVAILYRYAKWAGCNVSDLATHECLSYTLDEA